MLMGSVLLPYLLNRKLNKFLLPVLIISHNPDDFERKLFVLRNYATHTINNTVKKGRYWFLCRLTFL